VELIPEMTAEERELIATQTELLQTQMAQYEAMLPSIAHQMHYRLGDDNEWVRMSDQEWYNSPLTTVTERSQWDLHQSQIERQRKALAGEVPLTEAMKQAKQEEFKRLRRSTGTISGADPSSADAGDTIAAQRLAEFDKKWGLVEEAQRHGELGAANQAMMQNRALMEQSQRGAGQMTGLGDIYGQQASGYSSIMQPYAAYNQAAYQAQAANQATQMNFLNSMIGGAALLGGAALFPSRREYKKDIKEKTKKDEDKALKSILNTKSYEFGYKNKAFSKEKHLGSMVDESPGDIVNKDRTGVLLDNKIEKVNMALKALARKMEAA
jgi:hypothetical protein